MRRPTVLVIDDSPTIRKLVEIAARSTDWHLHFAATGRDGVATAAATNPDLVLLDFVLPDMKGVDVCRRLAGDVRTSRIPVLVVTAKHDGARDLFRQFPTFAGWLPKPFGADELINRVQQLLRESSQARRARHSTLTISREKKELAARAIYAVLKPQLGGMPSWVADLVPGSPVAPALARKLLTPQLVETLLEALVPVYREVLADEKHEIVPAPSDAKFRGSLHDWPIRDVLVLLGGAGGTGVLELECKLGTVFVYLRDGEVLLVSTREPSLYLGRSTGVAAFGGEVAADALALAEAEQRESGKPLFVSLAEAGALPKACDLGAALHHHSKHLLIAVLAESDLEFAWRESVALPNYVEAYGRHVSTNRDTLIGVPLSTDSPTSRSVAQLTLERLRADSVVRVLPQGVAFDRVRGFSEKVRELSLSASERKVLALVDGHSPSEQISSRSGLESAEVAHVMHRLTEIGLIRQRSGSSALGTYADSRGPGAILILEPDIEGFHKPLEVMLSSRSEPLTLVSLDHEPDVLEAIRRERARMVILNAELGEAVLASTVRAVREADDLAHVSMVAVLEHSTDETQAELVSQGFDAILVKPVAYAELERLIDQ